MPEPFPEPITASTRYCAVYGHPVRHSASPAMQNGGIAALGLNWRYLAFEVHPDDLPAALEGAKRMHFIGVNLTVPHKLLAVDMADVLDESAKTWGAVNTVRFEARDAHGAWLPKRPGATSPPSWACCRIRARKPWSCGAARRRRSRRCAVRWKRTSMVD